MKPSHIKRPPQPQTNISRLVNIRHGSQDGVKYCFVDFCIDYPALPPDRGLGSCCARSIYSSPGLTGGSSMRIKLKLMLRDFCLLVASISFLQEVANCSKITEHRHVLAYPRPNTHSRQSGHDRRRERPDSVSRSSSEILYIINTVARDPDSRQSSMVINGNGSARPETRSETVKDGENIRQRESNQRTDDLKCSDQICKADNDSPLLWLLEKWSYHPLL